MNALTVSHDPVLSLLDKRNVSENDILAVCEGNSEIKAKDVLNAFHIWVSLSAYIQEIESDWFSLLSDYEIDTEIDVDDFHLDLAIKVGARSQELLDEINTWDIQGLKRKVHRNRGIIVSSDATSLLAILVLRIISKFSKLEFKLHLSLSKSILIKINYELTGLLAKFGNKSSDTKSKGFMGIFGISSAQASTIKEDNPLLMKYRSFIKQLLQEMESTPFESVQQEMFQVVHDLRQMFLSFSDAAHNEASSSPIWNQNYTPEKYTNHKRNVSMASSSDRSTVFDDSNTKPKESIVDELPSIMAAFKDAERKQLSASTVGDNTSTMSIFKNKFKKDSMKLPMIHETGTYQRKLTSASVGNQLQSSASSLSRQSSSISGQPALPSNSGPPTPTPTPPAPPSQTLNVKMIDNRMMVKTSTGFVDMQQWLNRQNNQTLVVSDPPKPTMNQNIQPKQNAPPTSLPSSKPVNNILKRNSMFETNTSGPKTPISNNNGWKGLLTRVEKDFESSYASSMDF